MNVARSLAAAAAAMLIGCSGARLPLGVSQGSNPTLLPARAALSERAVYFFAGVPDGAIPLTGRLVFDSSGNLYGATNAGGSGTCSFRGVTTGCGAIVQISPAPSGWTERVIYNFKNHNDGAGPWGTLTLDGAGNIYGVTMAGGNRGCVPLFWVYHGCGTAFELARERNGWTKHTLFVFSGGTDGGNPAGSLVFDSAGNLYGTAFCGGGSYSCYLEGAGDGVFFQLKHGKSGTWSEHVLVAFERRHLSGGHPMGDLTLDRSGHIYGMADNVFEITHVGARWRYQQLILLGNNKFEQGLDPTGGPAFDAAGNIYGTMSRGGSPGCDCGLVFQASRSATGAYQEHVAHIFTGGSDGSNPTAGLVVDSNGSLYGTTANGGDLNCNNGGGCGVAFALQAQGGKWVENVLHTFEDNATDGGMPVGAFAFDRLGSLYGTTEFGGPGPGLGQGSIFEITR